MTSAHDNRTKGPKMISNRLQIRLLVAAAAILLAVVIAPATALGAGDAYVPGVTDSTTGVLADLERSGRGGDRYVPGVTDSATGVLRELERKGLEPRVAAPADPGSGFGVDDAAAVAGAGLAASVLAGGLALAAGARRRRVAT
jgi:hypothetical protein